MVKEAPKFILCLPTNAILHWYYNKFASDEIFQFRGKSYNYYYDLRGQTWRTERSVEIPIVWEIVKENQMKNNNILEVGNVSIPKISN